MSKTYIAPAKATKIYEEVCEAFNVTRPNVSHYIKYKCIGFPMFLAMFHRTDEHAVNWVQNFTKKCTEEWTQIRAKRYK